MRRVFILLALLVAGSGGGVPGEPAPGLDRHEIISGDAPGVVAFVRPGPPVLAGPGLGQDGPYPTPRGSSRRADPADAPAPVRLAARHAAFEASRVQHRRYATDLALTRAGLLSFHTDTPPPFRLI